MFSFPNQTRVYLWVQSVDMRQSFNELWAEARTQLREDPFHGALLFVFWFFDIFSGKLSFSYRKFARDEVDHIDHIIGIPEASGLSFNRGEDRVESFKVSCSEFT